MLSSSEEQEDRNKTKEKKMTVLNISKPPSGKLLFYFIVIMFFLLCVNGLALADQVDQNIIDRITNKYYEVGSTWGNNIKSTAYWLLKITLTVALVIMGLKLGLKKSTLEDFIEEFVILIAFGSAFFCLILYGQELSGKLISGMSKLSVKVGGSGQLPSEVFTNSLKISDIMLGLMKLYTPAVNILVAICGIITALCGALIYGIYILTLCEAWIVLNLGILLLGFGGFGSTRGFAVNFLHHSLGVGLRLFVVQCLINVLAIFLADMLTWEFEDTSEVIVITASFIILVFLVRTLPDSLARMISPHQSGTSAGAMTGAMAAGAGIAAGAASMGAGAAIGASGEGGLAGAVTGARQGFMQSLADAANAHLKNKKEEK